jgi:hypothetical protein
VFRNGGVRTFAIQSNLGDADTASTKLFEGSRSVVLTLPREQFVYDVRTARTIGKQTQLTVRLDPYEPSIFTTSSAAIPPPKISGPRRLRPGQTGTFVLTIAGPSPAAFHLFHLDVVDPSGRFVPHYAGNIPAPNGRATTTLPLAVNDNPGRWEVRVKDLLSGHARSSTVEVSASN